jgi:hypothetical protein
MPRFCLLLLFVLLATGQEIRPPGFPGDTKEDVKLPEGTSQKQAILKAEHKQSVEDAQKLAELAGEVQADLQKGDANVVSLKTIKQLDEIERLSKKIRGRLKRI